MYLHERIENPNAKLHALYLPLAHNGGGRAQVISLFEIEISRSPSPQKSLVSFRGFDFLSPWESLGSFPVIRFHGFSSMDLSRGFQVRMYYVRSVS